MKNAKTLILVILGLSVSASLGMWAYGVQADIGLGEIILFGSIGLIIILTLYIAYDRFKSERKGLPGEDEFTRRIREKAGAKAFQWSVYVLGIMSALTVDTGIRAELMLGIAIMIMGLIFLLLWFYYKRKGIEEDNCA